jgi:hypothetical protein
MPTSRAQLYEGVRRKIFGRPTGQPEGRPSDAYPNKRRGVIHLDTELLKVIAKEAAAKNTTREAVIAERFGVTLRPDRTNNGRSTSPPSLDC